MAKEAAAETHVLGLVAEQPAGADDEPSLIELALKLLQLQPACIGISSQNVKSRRLSDRSVPWRAIWEVWRKLGGSSLLRRVLCAFLLFFTWPGASDAGVATLGSSELAGTESAQRPKERTPVREGVAGIPFRSMANLISYWPSQFQSNTAAAMPAPQLIKATTNANSQPISRRAVARTWWWRSSGGVAYGMRGAAHTDAPSPRARFLLLPGGGAASVDARSIETASAYPPDGLRCSRRAGADQRNPY